MADHTAIEWTDASWNPIAGCTRVSSGCDICYAAQLAATRLKHTKTHGGLAVVTPSGRAAFNGQIRLLPDRLTQPLHWRKPRRIFVNSMSDLFHEGVPDDYVDRVFAAMALAPQHTYQVLTKRPQRMRDYMLALVNGQRPVCERASDIYGGITGGLMVGSAHRALPGSPNRKDAPPYDPWPFVWLGVSVEDQAAADERIPLLLQTPAAVRFISAEPLLGPISLPPLARLDWVIVGGESGRHARPIDLAWARALRDQCIPAGVPFLFKQWGGRTPKAGGRELDGRTWNQFPRGARECDNSTWNSAV